MATAPEVRVTDLSGNPVSGVSVTFAVTGGGGNITGGAATTDGLGHATLGSWTLGTTAGSNTLTATSAGLAGSPVTFTATGTAGAPDHLSFTVQPSTTQAFAPITPAVEVAVLDAFGNLVTGTPVDVTISLGNNPSGFAFLDSPTTLTRTTVNGVASFGDLNIDTPDVAYTLVATPNIGITAATSIAFDITP
ncbi:MAG: hypothetical protein IPK12_11350 [Gemmatimonadetes bacterium]|nr:hypothetical protein [Gemmatimonadota bacterium]